MFSTRERMDIYYDVRARGAPELRPRLSSQDSQIENAAHTTLSGVLEGLGPLPPFTSVLGICKDGLPLLVDLRDPSPGSILIQGDAHSGKARLMQSYLLSVGYLNPPDRVAMSVISPVPGLFEKIEKLPNCRAVLSAYERDASELVVEFSALAEQRKYGRHPGPVELLVLHDLPVFVQNNDYEVNAYLKWLIEHGPGSSIWTIASVKSSQLWRIHNRYYEAFGTYLTGSTKPASLLVDRETTDNEALLGFFATHLGDERVHFWSLQD